MADALIWFLVLELAGIVALPWVIVLFRHLPDLGLTLAKPAVLLALTYSLWVLGLLHLLPNTQLTAWAILLAVGAGSYWLVRHRKNEILEILRGNWPVLLASELIFISLFALWAFVVSGSPAVNHTEKPMDLMLLTAANQARYFPAEDSWLSGHAINYYYFGHIIVSFICKLSGVATSVGYNLGIVTIAAISGSLAFGLTYNLVRLAGSKICRAVAVGLAAPVLVFLAGNLAGALEFVRIRGWGGDGFWDWIAIKGLDPIQGMGTIFPLDFWWWFRSTRVIDTLDENRASLDYTITEFPVFSFLLGDLHAHVLAIPFFLLALAAILCVYLSPERLGPSWFKHRPGQAAFLALSVGSLAFTNFWDFPTVSALLAGALVLKGCRDYPESLLQGVNAAATVFLPLFVAAILLFLPFHLTAYSGQASGVLPLQEVATRPFLLFIVLGLFLVLSLGFLAVMLLRAPRPEQADAPLAATAMVVAILPIGIWVATGFLFELATDGAREAFTDLGRRLTLAGPGAVVVGVGSYCAMAIARRKYTLAAPFVLLLLSLGIYLLMGAELFHIVDSFGGAWRRMNTVFKFYYQAWLLLGIVSAFALGALWTWNPRRITGARLRGMGTYAAKVTCLAIILVLAVPSFYYTAGALADRSSAGSESRTMDGLAFLKSSSPGEYDAISWLRDQAEPGRIVEAVGEDYSEFSRVSAATGRAGLLGWRGHEIQWRGSHEALGNRAEDIATIYSGGNPTEGRRLLQQYGVRYVYLGSREREKYGVNSLSAYSDFLETAFREEDVIVYEFQDQKVIE